MFKPLINHPKKMQGASVVEFALVALPFVLLMLLFVVGGVTIFQGSIAQKAAEQAIVEASRIDRTMWVSDHVNANRGIPLNAQVVCTGTVSGRPDCTLGGGGDRRVLSSGRFDQIVAAAQAIDVNVLRENVDVTYGRYDEGISVHVRVPTSSVWSVISGQPEEMVGNAYGFVISKPI